MVCRQGQIDHIVVESTGVSEPLPVAQTFSASIKADIGGAAQGLQSLNDVAHLHSLVTVVDCSTFLTHLDSITNLEQLGMATGKDDSRPLAFLLAEQVQFANKILVNKTDLVTPEEAGKVEALLHRLNPSAEIERTQNSVIDVPTLLAHREYDESAFKKMPEWAEELVSCASVASAHSLSVARTHGVMCASTARGGQAKGPTLNEDGSVKSEAEEYGIKHFSIRELGRPFHPERWHNVLQDFELFSGVMRAKGCFWTTAEPGTRVDYSLVGNIANLIINTTWADVGMAMLKQGLEDGRFADRRSSVEGALQRLTADMSRLKGEGLWHPVTHDRRVDLVFIGDIQKMDEDRIRSAVQDAMLTEQEFEDFLAGRGPKPAEYANPFKMVPRCVKI